MTWLWVMTVFLAGAVAPVCAQSDLRFLQATPITEFKKVDIDLLMKALNQALDNGMDGVPVTWENPSAGNSGSITPEKDPQGRSGCRKARVENRHKTLHNANEAVFCKIEGKWKALSK